MSSNFEWGFKNECSRPLPLFLSYSSLLTRTSLSLSHTPPTFHLHHIVSSPLHHPPTPLLLEAPN